MQASPEPSRGIRGIAAALALLMAWTGPLHAQGRSENLVPSEGMVLRVDRSVATVLVADPEIANVQLVSDRTVFLFGKGVGRTRVVLLDAEDALIEEVSVTVRSPRPTVLQGR